MKNEILSKFTDEDLIKILIFDQYKEIGQLYSCAYNVEPSKVQIRNLIQKELNFRNKWDYFHEIGFTSVGYNNSSKGQK